ncbi:MAG: hypothetical protein P1P90_05705 [Patescibacteria group bacterium]|nr:hypothetical protein [Patescibacteria group bacterium]
MQTEFYSLQLSKFEALECLRALLLQALVEEEVRMQKGLELPEMNSMINRLMNMLNVSEELVERETDKSADELWEYSWYVFTSEWAWFRAQQEALRAIKKNKKLVNTEDVEYKHFAEKNFKKFFDKYVAELNMMPMQKGGVRKPAGKRKTDDIK